MSEFDQGEADVHHSIRNRVTDGQNQIGPDLRLQDVRRQEVDGRPEEGGERVTLRRAEVVQTN